MLDSQGRLCGTRKSIAFKQHYFLAPKVNDEHFPAHKEIENSRRELEYLRFSA